MSETLTIQLIVRNPDGQRVDPAQLSAVATHLTSNLRQRGHQVAPSETGARGGEWFNLIVAVAEQTKPLIGVLSESAAFVKTILEIRALLREAKTTGTVTGSTGSTTVSATTDDPRSDEALLNDLLAQLPADFDPTRAQITAAIPPRGRLEL